MKATRKKLSALAAVWMVLALVAGLCGCRKTEASSSFWDQTDAAPYESAAEEASDAAVLPGSSISFQLTEFPEITQSFQGTMYCTIERAYEVTDPREAGLELEDFDIFTIVTGEEPYSEEELIEGIETGPLPEGAHLLLLDVTLTNEDASIPYRASDEYGEGAEYLFDLCFIFKLWSSDKTTVMGKWGMNPNYCSRYAQSESEHVGNCVEVLPGQSVQITVGFLFGEETEGFLDTLYLSAIKAGDSYAPGEVLAKIVLQETGGEE